MNKMYTQYFLSLGQTITCWSFVYTENFNVYTVVFVKLPINIYTDNTV